MVNLWAEHIILYIVLVSPAFSTAAGATKKIYYTPGLLPQNRSFLTDFPETRVLHNILDTGRVSTFTLSKVEDAGFYTLKVTNEHGSYIHTDVMYHAIPSWLCKYSKDEYLLKSVPTTFFNNRTCVLPCTILGQPQPTFTWDKYSENEGWVPLKDLHNGTQKYVLSNLGHLFIKFYDTWDIGKYRCRARNECGQRCWGEPACSKKDVIGDVVELAISHVDTDDVFSYVLNPATAHCWNTPAQHINRTDLMACSALKPVSRIISGFSQYVSKNTSPFMEALIDFRRPQHDGKDSYRIGKVMWWEAHDPAVNFKILENNGNSGICISQIDKFNKQNMLEYYYCAAYEASTSLLNLGIRFEFIMTELPDITMTTNLTGTNVANTRRVPYGSKTKIQFTVHVSTAQYETNQIQDRWSCHFNSVTQKSDWHRRCAFDDQEDADILQFTIDYAVSGDSGYYQVMAGNDEGWTLGPAVLLVVDGREPDDAIYSLGIGVVTTTSVAVSWSRPPSAQKGAADLTYSVLYNNLDWSEGVQKLDENAYETVIRDLAPGVEYAISVYLEPEGGLVADERRIRTVPIATNAVVSLKCNTRANATTIFCTWTEPHARERHGTVFIYNIGLAGKRYTTREQNITLTQLDPHTFYTVSIVVCNELGCSQHNTSTNLQTPEVTPGEVSFKEPLKAGIYSITVRLQTPVPVPGLLLVDVVKFGEKEYNKFLKSAISDNDANSATYNSNIHVYRESEFTCRDLKPLHTYYLKFRWRTGAGPGNFTKFYKVTTKKYINYPTIFITLGVFSFLLILGVSIFLIVRRKWPGLVDSIRSTIGGPTYTIPDNRNEWEDGNDDNVMLEFVNFDI